MNPPVPRALVEAFYQAFAERNVDKIAPYFADDVEWTISGPVDVLTYCGRYRGKAAVLDMIARGIPAVIQIYKFAPELLLVDGDRSATLVRLRARCKADGRVISYRSANFLRFRDNKIVENLALIDSFDAVEQVLGHPLNVHDAPPPGDGDLIAV
jgi:ketosteroid isomerase-like protein